MLEILSLFPTEKNTEVCSLSLQNMEINSKFSWLLLLVRYLLPKVSHPPETKFQNQGIMQTKNPNLTFPTCYLFPRQSGQSPL